jgi:hypothetical protein
MTYLLAKYYGDNFQGFGVGTPYLALFKDTSNAPLPGRDVVVVLHVHDDEAPSIWLWPTAVSVQDSGGPCRRA